MLLLHSSHVRRPLLLAGMLQQRSSDSCQTAVSLSQQTHSCTRMANMNHDSHIASSILYIGFKVLVVQWETTAMGLPGHGVRSPSVTQLGAVVEAT